jgi:copper chaperone
MTAPSIEKETAVSSATGVSTTGVSTYRVEGLTCGHCVSAVTGELSAVDGVSAVTVDLSAGGASRVTVAHSKPLTDGQVAAALDEAGDYRLVLTAG